MDEVNCEGYETSLTDCDYQSSDDCSEGEAAGVICEDGPSDMANLTSSGELKLLTGSWEQGDFCLTNDWNFEHLDKEKQEGGILAVSCDYCRDQVPCTYAKRLFESIDWRRTGEIKEEIIVAVGDTNGDRVVDFDEWYGKLEDYVRVVFEVLDKNKDESIYEEAIQGKIFNSISLKFFEEALINTMDFFDSNKDNEVAFDDQFFEGVFSRRSDRNDDGTFTLSEVLHMPLINLPAPFYNLYTQVDRNKDERLSRGEAMDFLRRTFSLIDSNKDCSITEEEVVAALARIQVPSDQQLAISLILKQYLTLGSFLVKEFVKKADSDEDDKVTLEEVLNFQDFQFIDDMLPMVVDLGSPTGALTHLIGGSRYRRYGPRYDWESEQSFIAMWLTSLQELLNEPAYTAALPENICSIPDAPVS